MLHLLLVVVPLGLAAGVSPVMLTEQTVLLAAPGGRRAAWLYTTGTVTVLVLFALGLLVLGRRLSLPSAPHLDATLDLWIGAGLLVLAVAVHLLWPRDRGNGSRRRTRHLSSPAAFGFGAFAMATNVTTLALVVAATREVAASPVATWQRLLASALIVVLACLPAWGPIALAASAPHTADKVLEELDGLLRRYGRLLVLLLVAAGGVFLLVRGVIRLIDL
ncbi:MAG TPA: GAP family protein [Nocardioidaceae bacterium]|nr:GAP family protein [Nocardioidaceae bacterium]